ncbi:MAG: T9SS type A sorting domain-containing protein, partial [Ignavibacteriaceae bacterium]
SGVAWENYTQYMYTYDSNGNNTEYLVQNWDPINGWVNFGHYLLQYDSNDNRTEQLVQTWDAVGNQWLNSILYTYTYNSQNSVLTYLIQNWNSGTGWQNVYNIAYTYDANNNPSEVIFQIWDSGSSEWVNYLRQTGFVWITIVDVKEEGLIVDEFKLFDNYPNPFNPSTKIKFSVPSISNVNVTVFDVTGKEISSLVNQTLNEGLHEIEFRGNGYASGVYLYKLEAKSLDGKHSFVQTKKMILMK